MIWLEMRRRRVDICRKNALKMDTGFVPVVVLEDTTSYEMEEGVVQGVATPFTTFQGDGSTMGD
jgi:hypothetical protein